MSASVASTWHNSVLARLLILWFIHIFVSHNIYFKIDNLFLRTQQPRQDAGRYTKKFFPTLYFSIIAIKLA